MIGPILAFVVPSQIAGIFGVAGHRGKFRRKRRTVESRRPDRRPFVTAQIAKHRELKVPLKKVRASAYGLPRREKSWTTRAFGLRREATRVASRYFPHADAPGLVPVP